MELRGPRTFEELAQPILQLIRQPNYREIIRQLPMIGDSVDEIDERELEDLEFILAVMTLDERQDPELRLDPERRREIARQAECTLASVNSIFDQFEAARDFFTNDP